MRYLISVYSIYAIAAVGLTVWLARTLFRNGALFLEDVFPQRPALAAAVNRLLVVGFFMLNLGYAFLILRSDGPADGTGAFEVLAAKLGLLLVSLGVIHFVNLAVFHLVRRRARHDAAPRALRPPAAPMWGPAPVWVPQPAPAPQPGPYPPTR